jgi:hypothetical protein
MGIDCIVLGLTPTNRLHIEGMAQDEGNPLVGAEVGQPVPGKDAFDAHDQIFPVRCNGLKERLGGRFHMAVEKDLSILLYDAKGPSSKRAGRCRSKICGASCRSA